MGGDRLCPAGHPDTRRGKPRKKRRQWIEDLPDNLWKWLKKTPKEIFDLDERQIRHRRQMAFKRAGLLIEADDIAQGESQAGVARGSHRLP